MQDLQVLPLEEMGTKCHYPRPHRFRCFRTRRKDPRGRPPWRPTRTHSTGNPERNRPEVTDGSKALNEAMSAPVSPFFSFTVGEEWGPRAATTSASPSPFASTAATRTPWVELVGKNVYWWVSAVEEVSKILTIGLP